MLLRFNNPHPTIIEVTKMSYSDGHGLFYTVDYGLIKTTPISESEWARLVADMFVDGKLSYTGEVTVLAGQRHP